MYNSKTIRAAMLTNTTTFSFFFCGSFRLALSRYRQSCWCCCYALWWTYICMRLRIRDYSCQQLLSLCVILALSLSLWGCWLNDTEFYLGAFGCQLLCGELHTYSTVWMFVHLCLWKRFYWLVSAVERGGHREKERERWRAPIVDRQLFWFFNLTTTAGNRQRTHVQMYTCTHCT